MKVHQIFFRPIWEGLYLILAFPSFDISIHSGNMCDQSQKLSKVAPITALANFNGAGPKKSVPKYLYLRRSTPLNKFGKDKFGQVW